MYFITLIIVGNDSKYSVFKYVLVGSSNGQEWTHAHKHIKTHQIAYKTVLINVVFVGSCVMRLDVYRILTTVVAFIRKENFQFFKFEYTWKSYFNRTKTHSKAKVNTYSKLLKFGCQMSDCEMTGGRAAADGSSQRVATCHLSLYSSYYTRSTRGSITYKRKFNTAPSNVKVKDRGKSRRPILILRYGYISRAIPSLWGLGRTK
jgi:hypothetical protein